MKRLAAPQRDEYHEFYHTYVQLVDPQQLPEWLAGQVAQLREILGDRTDEEVSCLHEPYTWTLKQVVGHLIDCEREFGHRMWRIGLGDEEPIPGIDQQMYVDALDYSQVSMAQLLDEFDHLRQANRLAAERLTEKHWNHRGMASNYPVTARASLYMLVGHVAYHLKIIRSRLGMNPDD